jgi:aspartate racemase
MKQIGIVGCSAEGAALCYRTICAEAGALIGTPDAHPPVTMHTASLADYYACLEAGDIGGVAALMLESALRLKAAGADFCICPDNTIHQAYDLVIQRSPLPWLHIADVAVAEAVARGFRRIGLMGTRWLMDSAVYPRAVNAAGLVLVRPAATDRVITHRVIVDELVRGIVSPVGTAALGSVVKNLAAQGCEAVILGCTELPLALDEAGSPVPLLDTTRLLARAAISEALGPAGA